jgi:EmrB/QacA subfamily drug resistance transporter
MLTEISRRQKAIIMGSVMLGLFVSAMDQTVVATATPRVVAELGGLSLYSWVFTSYMLTSTTVVPIVGKLGDMYGRKPLFMGGIALFMLASLLSGASQSIEQLILFRGIQGIGAGMIMANSFTIIGDLFPPSERGKYQGLFSGVFGLASVLGPFIGGYLTDNYSWRWVFYVNIPIGMVALPALHFGLPWVRVTGVKRSIDYLGTLTLVLATVPLLLACVWIGERRYAFASPQAVALLSFSALMIGAFIWSERRAVEPILPLELFRNRVFAVSIVVMFITGLAMFGVLSFVPLFVQGALGKSATRSGSVTVPMMMAMVTMSIVGGQIVSRTGRYKVQSLIGTLFITAGIYLLSRMSADTSQAVASFNIILVGIGMGLSMPVFGVAVQNAVEHRLLGVVSSASQFFRQIGGTLGVAILGAALTAQLSGEIARTLPDTVRAAAPPELLALSEDAQTMLNPFQLNRLREGFAALGPEGGQLFAQALATMRVALADALSHVFLIGALLMVVAVVANLFLPEIPLRRSIRAAGEAGEAAQPVPGAEPVGAAGRN